MMANLFDAPSATPVGKEPRRRRGVFLLPSLFTVGNMFCGYACIVFAMGGQLEMAAPFIGIAFVLDSLDGRIARLTGSTSAFGVEFDSLADVISFGAAPAVLAFEWGLKGQGKIGWAAGFIFMSAGAIRLARVNEHSSTHQGDKRYFIGMPIPAAAGVVAATIYAFPDLPEGQMQAAAAVAVMLVPAALMVSAIRFRSFKNINFDWNRSYLPLLFFVVLVALVAERPRITFLVMAYSYLASGLIEWMVNRVRTRRDGRSAPLP
jgi:CDP-diacylglycerol--serine O-phosphatidyltransferase